MKKLIVSDVDGTLLNSNQEIGEFDKKMIEKAMKNDIGFTIASGRMYSAINYLIKEIGTDIPVSSLNGTIIVDSKTKEIVKKHPLEKEKINKILDILVKNDVFIYYYTKNSLISSDLKIMGSYYAELNKRLPEDEQITILCSKDLHDLPDDDIYKIVALDENRKNFDKISEGLEKLGGLNYCSSWFNNIEITSSEASKGKSAEEIAKYLGVDIKNVMIIGDHENDLSMFETDAFKVAMGNAQDSLKEKADFVTSDNNNGGLGKAIEVFMER